MSAVEIVLGLGAALAYGAADFIGGLASRRTAAFAVVLLSQVAGSVLLVAVLPFFDNGRPTTTELGWGAVAGVAGGLGVAGLYRGLAIAPMNVIAPITAVVAATVPVVFGVATGERPSAPAALGAAVALVAVALVSLSPGHPGDPGSVARKTQSGAAGIMLAAGAGVAFGVFFILVRHAAEGTGLWSLVGVRIGSMTTAALLVAATATSLRPPGGALPQIACAGILDTAANVLYLLAAQRGLLSLVAVLTSMYPASTVLLARIVLGERLTVFRLVGLAAAAVGVALIATG
ncbi:MAG: DMT family transporter [Actinomycetota bacterium]